MKLGEVEGHGAMESLVLPLDDGQQFLAERQMRAKDAGEIVEVYRNIGELAGGRDRLIVCRACSA